MLFVEGDKTEPGYFFHWYRLYRERVIVNIASLPNVTTPIELVERAIKQRAADTKEAKRGKGDTFDEYWCVFDVDDHPHLERYSKPHVIEKKKSARAASNASW